MARTRVSKINTVWDEDEANKLLEADPSLDLLGVFPHPAEVRVLYYVLVRREAVRD